MNDYIYHWGIKGQKWGVRRFQNEDGTLTEAGRSRYGDRPSRDIRKKLRAANKLDAKEMEFRRNAERATKDRDRETFSSAADAAKKHKEEILDSIRKSGNYEVTSREVKRVTPETKAVVASVLAGAALMAVNHIIDTKVPIAKFVVKKPPRTTWGTAADY